MALETATTIAAGTEPAWSPDGRTVAYRNTKGDFVLRHITEQNASKLFSGKDVWTPLQWSPDGRYVMFVGGFGSKDLGLNCLEPKKVMLYELPTKKRRFVHQLCKSAPYFLAWATSDACSPAGALKVGKK